MQEIKSCQFCGSDDQKIVSFSNGANSPVAEHYIVCDNCGAQGPIDVNSESAILKWNSRIQEAPEMPQERPQIIDRYNARNFICPFRDISKDEGCSTLCMMWVSVGEDKGRCGLVNTMFINSTGCVE